MTLTESKLKESEERYKTLVETTSDWIWEVDGTGIYTYSNPKVKDILGYEVNEVIGKTPFDFMPPDEAEKVLVLFQKVKETKEPIVILKNKNIHKDGYIVTLETSGVPFFDENGTLKGYRGIDRDISEKLEAERKLKESEEKLYHEQDLIHVLLSNHPDFIYFKDSNARYQHISKNFSEYFGRPIEDIIGKTDLELFPREISNQPHSEDLQIIKTGIPLINKEDTDGETWVLSTKLPWFDKDGNIKGLFGISRDITERKMAEEALKQSETKYKKAYDRGNFYKDLFAHDINNILQVINSSAELITYHIGESEKSKKIQNISDIIRKQVNRGAKLISNIRKLAELEEREIITRKVEIVSVLNNSIVFVEKAYEGRNVNFSLSLIDGDYFTHANELLQDVFENVLINGIKYNDHSDIEILIKTSRQKIEYKDYVKIEFIDNGIGVSDERKEVIFLEGNRELKGSKGMGLGLSLVSKILTIYKGEIWVEDKIKGKYSDGSNFIILLPEVK